MSNFDGINHYQESVSPTGGKKRKKLKWFLFFALIIIVAGVGFGGFKLLSKTSKIFTNKKSIFTRVGSLFLSNSKPLIGEDSGIVNVLLLGIGGEGHDGANLTDTMMVASINIKTNEVVLTSIPRDWFMPIQGHGLNKINAVYAYSLLDHNKDTDTAGQDAIKAVEQVTGFDIHYYALVDFKGFVSAVDHVGGLDIHVDRTFTDSSFPDDYPKDTSGYLSPVTFTQGDQHMNGQRALIFARSRHGNNEEGSDFARSERQKKILVAFKDKISSLNVTNLNTLNNLLSDFTSNFRTNLEPYELLRLANIVKDINGDNVYSLSLEPQDNLICATTIDQLTGRPYIHPVETTPTDSTSTDTNNSTSNSSSSTSTNKSPASQTDSTNTATSPTAPPTTPTQIPMYIVEPCEGKSLSDIHQFLLDYWDTARLKKEGATIEVQNSTGKLAATTSWKKLPDELTVNFITFPGKVAFDRTILYDNSRRTKPNTLNYLKQHFNFTTADVTYPNSKADFVIVVGNDSL